MSSFIADHETSAKVLVREIRERLEQFTDLSESDIETAVTQVERALNLDNMTYVVLVDSDALSQEFEAIESDALYQGRTQE